MFVSDLFGFLFCLAAGVGVWGISNIPRFFLRRLSSAESADEGVGEGDLGIFLH
jgi:hypothetical protein